MIHRTTQARGCMYYLHSSSSWVTWSLYHSVRLGRWGWKQQNKAHTAAAGLFVLLVPEQDGQHASFASGSSMKMFAGFTLTNRWIVFEGRAEVCVSDVAFLWGFPIKEWLYQTEDSAPVHFFLRARWVVPFFIHKTSCIMVWVGPVENHRNIKWIYEF